MTSAMVAPPNAPASTPTSEMPTCTAARKRLGLSRQLQGRRGAEVALVGPLLEFGLPGRHHGDFGHGKDAVREDQNGDDDNLEPDTVHQRILTDLARAWRPGAMPGRAGCRPALRLDMPEKRRSVAQDSLLRGVSRPDALGMLVFARDDTPPRPASLPRQTFCAQTRHAGERRGGWRPHSGRG